MNTTTKALKLYFENRPHFLGLIRCKEIDYMVQNLSELLNSKKKLKILDFGCGDGFYLSILGEFVDLNSHEIIGVDITETVLEDAKKYNLYSSLDVYDGEKLPYEDETFDLVISNCVLEHVSELSLNIKEISRVMKKEALFHTTVMSANWDNYLFGSILLGDRYMKWMRKKQVHKNLLDMQKWINEFANADLKVMETKGYIDKSTGRILDFMHYVSVPSLFTKKIFNKWILFPKLVDIIKSYKWFAKKYDLEIDPNMSAAIYFILKK